MDYDSAAKLVSLEWALEVADLASTPKTEGAATTAGHLDFEARAQAIVAREPPASKEQTPVQLPIWPEPHRGQANALVRSAVFGSAQRRRMVTNELLAAWGKLEIRLTGSTLNQFDETVWMQLVHMWRLQGEPQDFRVRFKAKTFMRSLGRKSSGGKCVTEAQAACTRLGSFLALQNLAARETNALQADLYSGPLVTEFASDTVHGLFVVTLNPKFLQLFGAAHTRLDWQTRLRLSTGLATWLHRYVLSHQATATSPHRIATATLKELSGSKSSPKEFKRSLKRSMTALQQEQIVTHWRITPTSALEFCRPPTNRKP